MSVRAENAVAMADECPFVYVVQLLGTHWRPAILWRISTGTVTYNALRETLKPITDKMLATDLLALVQHGLVVRHEFSSKPRRTRYELTPRGDSIIPVLRIMQAWTEEDLRNVAQAERSAEHPLAGTR